jgi:hypothetical protein
MHQQGLGQRLWRDVRVGDILEPDVPGQLGQRCQHAVRLLRGVLLVTEEARQRLRGGICTLVHPTGHLLALQRPVNATAQGSGKDVGEQVAEEGDHSLLKPWRRVHGDLTS